jgi:hypothetical protein
VRHARKNRLRRSFVVLQFLRRIDQAMRSGSRRDWLIVDSSCFILSCRLTLSVTNAHSVLESLDESAMRSLAAAHQSRTASPASPSPNHDVRPLAPRNNNSQQPLSATVADQAGHFASNMEVGSLAYWALGHLHRRFDHEKCAMEVSYHRLHPPPPVLSRLETTMCSL